MKYIWQSNPAININWLCSFFDLLSTDLLEFPAKNNTDLLAHAVSDVYVHLVVRTAQTNYAAKLSIWPNFIQSECFRTISQLFIVLNNWFDCWLAVVRLYWWCIYFFLPHLIFLLPWLRFRPLAPLNPRQKSELAYSFSMPALTKIPRKVTFSERWLLKNRPECLVRFSLLVFLGCLRAPCLSRLR